MTAQKVPRRCATTFGSGAVPNFSKPPTRSTIGVLYLFLVIIFPTDGAPRPRNYPPFFFGVFFQKNIVRDTPGLRGRTWGLFIYFFFKSEISVLWVKQESFRLKREVGAALPLA